MFTDLPDPRIETANKLHPLAGILVIAICAVIAEYGRAKEPFFRRFLAPPHGVPSHDSFERVFAKLRPDAFADRFGRWMTELCDSAELTHIAVDGKSSRAGTSGAAIGSRVFSSSTCSRSRTSNNPRWGGTGTSLQCSASRRRSRPSGTFSTSWKQPRAKLVPLKSTREQILIPECADQARRGVEQSPHRAAAVAREVGARYGVTGSVACAAVELPVAADTATG